MTTPASIARTPDSSENRRARLAVRSRAAVHIDGGYSRFVGMMKMLLPIVALALTAAIFAWPSEFEEAGRLEIAFVEAKGKEADRLTMLNPRYLGTDSEQRPFVVTAKVAEQDPKDQRRVSLSEVQADMSDGEGGWFSVSARGGIFHQGESSLYLLGPIEMFSAAGYEFRTGSAHVDLKAGTAETVDKVAGHGPFGAVTADRLLVSERGRVLLFSGHVRLVITPPAGS